MVVKRTRRWRIYELSGEFCFFIYPPDYPRLHFTSRTWRLTSLI